MGTMRSVSPPHSLNRKEEVKKNGGWGVFTRNSELPYCIEVFSEIPHDAA